MGHTRPPAPSRTPESTDADTPGVLGLGPTPGFKRTKCQKFCEEFVSIMDHFNVFFINIAKESRRLRLSFTRRSILDVASHAYHPVLLSLWRRMRIRSRHGLATTSHRVGEAHQFRRRTGRTARRTGSACCRSRTTGVWSKPFERHETTVPCRCRRAWRRSVGSSGTLRGARHLRMAPVPTRPCMPPEIHRAGTCRMAISTQSDVAARNDRCARS